jgi:hypothetical protein
LQMWCYKFLRFLVSLMASHGALYFHKNKV